MAASAAAASHPKRHGGMLQQSLARPANLSSLAGK